MEPLIDKKQCHYICFLQVLGQGSRGMQTNFTTPYTKDWMKRIQCCSSWRRAPVFHISFENGTSIKGTTTCLQLRLV